MLEVGKFGGFVSAPHLSEAESKALLDKLTALCVPCEEAWEEFKRAEEALRAKFERAVEAEKTKFERPWKKLKAAMAEAAAGFASHDEFDDWLGHNNYEHLIDYVK